MKNKFRKDIGKIKILKLSTRITYTSGGSWCFFLRYDELNTPSFY